MRPARLLDRLRRHPRGVAWVRSELADTAAEVAQQRCSVSKDGGGIFEEAVEQDEEITEAGGEGDHGRLAPGAELLVGHAGLHLGAEQTDECGSPLPLGSGDSNREGRRRSKPVPSPKAAEDCRTPRPRGIRPPHEKSRNVFGVRGKRWRHATSDHIRPEEGCDPKQRTLVALPVCCIAGWQPAGRRCFQGQGIDAALAVYPPATRPPVLRSVRPPLLITPASHRVTASWPGAEVRRRAAECCAGRRRGRASVARRSRRAILPA